MRYEFQRVSPWGFDKHYENCKGCIIKRHLSSSWAARSVSGEGIMKIGKQKTLFFYLKKKNRFKFAANSKKEMKLKKVPHMQETTKLVRMN